MQKHIRALLDHIVPGPVLGLWSWRYLDKWRTVRLVTSRKVWRMYTKFHHSYPVGSKLPAVELARTDGTTVSTEAFNGEKHFVMWTGAIT
ncbi:MAG: hypothetical protein OEM97_05785 [Acidimicrobiia bacterium]|nr:hypothetical protein [Acidimicrobiia bacterium]